MKAKWMDEVSDILQSGRFNTGYTRLQKARQALEVARLKHEELLTQVNLLQFRAELAHRKAIDTLERGNVLEDESAVLAREAADLDNASFEAVSQFEIQRKKCTELWERLGSLEIDVDVAKDAATKQKLQRLRERLGEEYEREDQKKRKLWAEFEALVFRNTDRNLALRERQHKAKLVRHEAEQLFQRHEEEASQASRLKADAEKIALERERCEQEVQAAYDELKRELECLLGVDFLYWPAREDNKLVYATPLIDDTRNYLVPLVAGRLYRCDHRAGIDGLLLIEPTAKPSPDAPTVPPSIPTTTTTTTTTATEEK